MDDPITISIRAAQTGLVSLEKGGGGREGKESIWKDLGVSQSDKEQDSSSPAISNSHKLSTSVLVPFRKHVRPDIPASALLSL